MLFRSAKNAAAAAKAKAQEAAQDCVDKFNPLKWFKNLSPGGCIPKFGFKGGCSISSWFAKKTAGFGKMLRTAMKIARIARFCCSCCLQITGPLLPYLIVVAAILAAGLALAKIIDIETLLSLFT